MKYTLENIAQYVDGLMEAEEQQAFEAALATDKELQEQLALYREVDTSLQQEFAKDEEREQLKTALRNMRPIYFGAKANTTETSEGTTTPSVATPSAAPAGKVVSMKRYLGAAIAVAAMLVVILLVWNPFAGNLYEKYADTKMMAQVERGSHLDTVLLEATTAFNNREFNVAAVNLAEVIQHQPDNSFALFYFGISLMQTNQVPAARAVFEKLFKGESAYKYEAAFYEALSFLKEKDEDTAKDWLEKIPADAPNYTKAQELMKKL